MTTEELTTEVLALKKALADLQRRVGVTGPVPKRGWLPAVLGRFKDDPEFDKAVEAGRRFRETGYVAPPAEREDGEE